MTDTMILSRLKNGENVTLLVPEQEVMEAERRIADRAEAEGVFCEKLTVVSFRRLANLAFRRYGGIEYKSLGDGGRLIVIWRIIEELVPVLKAYGKNRDRALCELMLSVCTELKRYRVTASALSSVSDKLSGTPLGDRLSDISLIYAAYIAQMKDEYSDSIDDVERLADILSEHAFLSDTSLFADSFNGFTSNELRVLEYAMRSCDLTVTLCRPDEDGRIGFMTVEKTEKQLISLAVKHNVKIYEPIRIPSDSPYISEKFRLIEEELWSFGYNSDSNTSNDALALVCCRDRFYEAEYIANRICELIRNGARYRDIAVIGRNSEEYEGILDVTLERYDIPVFLSHRSRLISTPYYRALSDALDVISGGFKNEDIISYIKCGCTGLSDSDINLVESYTAMWGMNGSIWSNDYDWNMNPRGFSDVVNSDTAEKLEKLNEIKRYIREPLIKLRDSLRGNCNVKEGVTALYVFMGECGCRKNAAESSEREDITVYNAVMSLFDTLCEVGHDIPVNARVLKELLYMAAKNTDFGRIPQSFDCVLAGDAAILRASGREHIFLTACEDGIFPRAVSDDSFFSDTDRSVLLDNGIELSADTKEKNDNEMFYFLRAALSASKTLTATCIQNSKGKYPMSSGFKRLTRLYPANTIKKYPEDFSAEERLQTLSTALEIITPSEGNPIYRTLREIYKENGVILPLHRIPLSEIINRVSLENTEKLFGHRLNMSQTRFEDYAKCPFSYYSKHILALAEQEHASFKANEIGSYLHKLLERVVSYIFPIGEKRREFSDTELDDIISREASSISKTALGDLQTGRSAALITRLKMEATFLIKNLISEFEHSKFAPRYFELPIGTGVGNIEPLKASADDGSEISLYGYIDRVDTFKRGDDAYVRVVDYKTGSTKHSLDRISLGIDMQMLLYLFAICSSDSKELRASLGISENGRILPAGVLYHKARVRPIANNTPLTPSEAQSRSEGALLRSGVLLKDAEILDAMEEGMEGRFIAFKKQKEPALKEGGSLKTSEELDEIASVITSKMSEIGSGIKSGNADASPIETKDIKSCEYCKLKPFCRRFD